MAMQRREEMVDHKISHISTQLFTADFVETKMLSSEDSAQRCLVLGRRGHLEHFGIGAQASASSARVRDSDLIQWKDIVRFEADRIVVSDSAEEA